MRKSFVFGAGVAGAFIALLLFVASCMKVDITMPEGPRGADGLSAYEIWKAKVADGTLVWDKNATEIVDFFKYLKGQDGRDGIDGKDGRDGKDGLSAYDQWKSLIASGTIDDPHHKGQKWSAARNSVQDFWIFLTGATGENGQTPRIGDNGNWWIGDFDTKQPARGAKGEDGKSAKAPVVTIGVNGNWYINGEDTGRPSRGIAGADGSAGFTAITIGDNGNWYINGQDTGKPSRGVAGKDGKDGKDGRDGRDGKDGTTGAGNTNNNTVNPTITVSPNNTWVINGVDTGKPATDGKDGKDGKDGRDGRDGRDGKDGKTVSVVIGDNGNWFIDGVDSGKPSKGEAGPQGPQGKPGKDGQDGQPGKDGKAAQPVIPTIGNNGNWWIGDQDLGKPARGNDGHSPKVTIENKHWYIDGEPTGRRAEPEVAISNDGYWVINGEKQTVKAFGEKGDTGAAGAQGEKGEKGETGAKGAKGEKGDNGKSTYDLWKEDVAKGLDDPKNPGQKWPTDKVGRPDFWEYLCARTCTTCKEIEDAKKPTVEFIKTDELKEYVDWRTGMSTLVAKDHEGNIIPNSNVTLPNGVTVRTNDKGEAQVANKDLPKGGSEGYGSVVVNGMSKQTANIVKVPSQVEVRWVSYRGDVSNPEDYEKVPAQFPKILPSRQVDEFTISLTGVARKKDPAGATGTNHVTYQVVLQRRMDPKDPWFDFPDEISKVIENDLQGVKLIPLRVSDKTDPTSIDSTLGQIKTFGNDVNKKNVKSGRTGYDKNGNRTGNAADMVRGKRIILTTTIRRQMLKNYKTYNNWQPDLYDQKEVYFTFKLDKDITPLYGVQPKFKTTFQLPPLQLIPHLKKLVMKDPYMDKVRVSPEELNEGGVLRYKSAEFIFDFKDTQWDCLYENENWVYDYNEANGTYFVHGRKVENAKDVRLLRVDFIEDDTKGNRPGTLDGAKVSNIFHKNLGGFNNATCETDDPSKVEEDDPKFAQRADPSSKFKLQIDYDSAYKVNGPYSGWFQPMLVGTMRLVYVPGQYVNKELKFFYHLDTQLPPSEQLHPSPLTEIVLEKLSSNSAN